MCSITFIQMYRNLQQNCRSVMKTGINVCNIFAEATTVCAY